MADVASSSNDTTPTLQEEGDKRLQGRVKWFNNRAGFGFLTVLNGLNTNKDVLSIIQILMLVLSSTNI